MEKYLALCLDRRRFLIGEVDGGGTLLASKSYEAGYVTGRVLLPVVRRALEDYITTLGWSGGVRPSAMGLAVGRGIDPVPSLDGLGRRFSEIYNIPCRADLTVAGVTRALEFWGGESGAGPGGFVYIDIGEVLEAGIFPGSGTPASRSNAPAPGSIHLVERRAGEWAIDRRARELRGEGRLATHLYMADDEHIAVDMGEVFFRADLGDELCLRLVDETLRTTIDFIAAAVTAPTTAASASSLPEKIILGGSMLAGDFLYPRLRERIRKGTHARLFKKLTTLPHSPDQTSLMAAAAIAAAAKKN